MCIGLTGHKYLESTLLEAVTARSASLEFILMIDQFAVTGKNG